MSKGMRSIVLVSVAIVAVAIVVLLLLPAPDPLRGADTVYVEMPGTEGGISDAASALQDQLEVVLNERNLEIVADRAAADVVLSVRQIDFNLGDIEFRVSRGEINGQAKAVIRATDLRTGVDHTMDLIVRVRDGRVSASLEARKFYEFWK